MESWELIARESIRDLVARYNANGDSGRFDAVLDLFLDNALVEVAPRVYRGREEIRLLFTGAARPPAGRANESPPERVWHHTSTHQIDLVDEQFARGRCYFQVLTGAGLDHWGRYLDEYRSSAGRWRFAARRISIDGAVPGGWADRREGDGWERREDAAAER